MDKALLRAERARIMRGYEPIARPIVPAVPIGERTDCAHRRKTTAPCCADLYCLKKGKNLPAVACMNCIDYDRLEDNHGQ